MIRSELRAYTLADQKSVLAPAKRLTGGFNGAFSPLLFFTSCRLAECASGNKMCIQHVSVGVRPRLYVTTVHIYTQDCFRQAFAIPALPPAGFGGRRTPSLAFVRYERVEVLSNLDTSTICFIGSARHVGSLAKCDGAQPRVSTTSYRV